MSIDRRNRITFEEMADLYDEIRQGYPGELIEEVLSLSGIPAQGRILEIGCGPGNATLPFARRGFRILGIELGERLAALAAKNCQAYPGVEIRNISFEDWEPEEEAFDLALSADAFHWIPPEIGYPKVARALKASGSAAFFWNAPVDPGTDWSKAIDAVYQSTAPGLNNPDKAFTEEWLVGVIQENFAESGCFGEVTVRRYPWSRVLDAEQYLKQLRTYSGHRGVDAATRVRLYAGIREVVESYGGRIVKPQLTVLFHARVKK
jgi:SAM-dependent methyltransferase